MLIGLLALVLGGFAASAEDASSLDASVNQSEPSADSMTWPMLPGESLNDVARLFYPKNIVMQKYFVSKALQLSADVVPNLKATQRFESPTLLVIPTLKSLSKKASKSRKQTNKQSLKMSYGLQQIAAGIPAKLKQEYDELVSKNTFLKEQLAILKEKIVILESKLESLKLMLDKNLSLPSDTSPVAATPTDAEPAAVINKPAPSISAESAAGQAPVKKVFKNLTKTETQSMPAANVEAPAQGSWLDSLGLDKLALDNLMSSGLIKAILAGAALLLLGAYALKKYRHRMLDNLSFAATKMQNTVTDFSGYFEKTKLEKIEPGPETIQHQQAVKQIETRLSSTLDEAKLLMSVNRGADAIAHLKMTIESQPKASINHWLYLLEVFRKLNLKNDFEEYANRMHETFNVMTPVWYEKEAVAPVAMVVAQSLEEFPHIMEQLYGVWPGELAGVYLRSLITDNRAGERTGFGKSVVNEILFLIEILDSYKDIPN